MIDDKSIMELLKQLRFTGMQQTIEERFKQADNNDWSCREFFITLLQDEIQYKKTKSLALRIRKAKFEQLKTMEELKLPGYPAKIQKIIRDLSCCQFIHEPKHIIIMGPTGTGKTHLAQALGHQACRYGKSVKFVRANQQLNSLKAARADNSWEIAHNQLIKPDLLIIDDFGLKSLTNNEAEDIYELVARRYLKKSMIFTSNRKMAGWLELFPDPVMGNAALDRLGNLSYQIVLDGDSYRKKQRPEVELDNPSSKQK